MATEVSNPEGLYGFECVKLDSRRNYDHETRTHEISRLWQRSHEMINLAVRGFSYKDIAEILCVDPQTVSNTLNSELAQKKVADLRQSRDDEVKKDVEKIRVLKNKAMEVYHEILDNTKGEATLNDRKKVADTILTEFSGLREPIKVQSTHAILTKSDIEDLKKRAIESGAVIDSSARDVTEEK